MPADGPITMGTVDSDHESLQLQTVLELGGDDSVSEAGGSRHGPRRSRSRLGGDGALSAVSLGAASELPPESSVGVSERRVSVEIEIDPDSFKVTELESNKVVWKTCGEKRPRFFCIPVFGCSPVALRLDCTHGLVFAFASFLTDAPDAERHSWKMREVGTSDPASEIVLAGDSPDHTLWAPLYVGIHSHRRSSRFGIRAVCEPINKLSVTSGSMHATASPKDAQFFQAEMPPGDGLGKRVVLLRAEVEGPGPLRLSLSRLYPYPDEAHHDFITVLQPGQRVTLPMEVAGDTGRLFLGAHTPDGSQFKCTYTLSLRVKRPEGRIPNRNPRELAALLRARRSGRDADAAVPLSDDDAGYEDEDEGDEDARDTAQRLLRRQSGAGRKSSTVPPAAAAHRPSITARPHRGARHSLVDDGAAASLGPSPSASLRHLPPAYEAPASSPPPRAESPSLRGNGVVERLIADAIATRAAEEEQAEARRLAGAGGAPSWRGRRAFRVLSPPSARPPTAPTVPVRPAAARPSPPPTASGTPRLQVPPGPGAASSVSPPASRSPIGPRSPNPPALNPLVLPPSPPVGLPPAPGTARSARLAPLPPRSSRPASGSPLAAAGSPRAAAVRLPATAMVLEMARQREQDARAARAERERDAARRRIVNRETGRWALDRAAGGHSSPEELLV